MQPLKEEEEGEEDGDGGDGDGGREKGLDKNFEEGAKKEEGRGGLSVALKSLFRCTTCSSLLPPPAPLYQVLSSD